MENPIKMDDLGVALFLETPIYIYIYIKLMISSFPSGKPTTQAVHVSASPIMRSQAGSTGRIGNGGISPETRHVIPSRKTPWSGSLKLTASLHLKMEWLDSWEDVISFWEGLFSGASC